MLIVEMGKIESIGGHIEIMLVIEITKIKLTKIKILVNELIGSHIGIMLIIEMAKIELIGGHIGLY